MKLAFHQPVYDVSTANLNWIPERFVTAAGKKREALSSGHTLDQVCRGLQMVVSTTKARQVKFFRSFECKESADVIHEEMKRLMFRSWKNNAIR